MTKARAQQLRARTDFSRVLDLLRAAAVEAGDLVMPFFQPGAKTSAAINSKAGGSPVTEADILADTHLKTRLLGAYPEAGWLSEESADDARRLGKDLVFVVDPIDGTRGFMAGDPRWTICAALVCNGKAVAGIVHAPALGETYAAIAGRGATLNGGDLRVSARASLEGARVAGPKGLLDTLQANVPTIEPQPKIPSLAYRLTLVAAGRFEAAFAAPNCHDWDIAAADIILQEAGGVLTGLDGAPLVYNRAVPRHSGLVAAPARIHAAALAAANGAARHF